MKLLKTDRIIPLVTIGLIVLFSFMLYVDFTSTFTRSRASEIGVLTYKKKIAERRFAEEVLWEKIDRNATVYNCDYLRTMDGSGAVVNLKDNSRIEIGENTLVLVCYSDQGVQIGLDKGSIAARRTAGGREMRITSGNASINMKKGVLSVNKSKEGVNLSVSSGRADLTVEGKKERVDPGKNARVTGDRVTVDRITVRQVSPDINHYYVTAAKEQAVNFTWEAEGQQRVLLQVAKDSAFETIVGKASSAGTGAAVTLPAGSYYWRLTDGKGKPGPARKFTVVADRPALQLSPLGGQQFAFREKRPFIVFRWKGSGAATSYAVDVSRDPAFKDRVLSLASDKDSIATDALAAGTYYWRVRSLYGFNPDAELVSQAQQFTIAPAAALSAPEQLLPKEGDALSDLSFTSGSALFNWQGSRDFTGYDFRIARDREFKNIIYQKKIGVNYHKPKLALAKGTYYWSVSGVTAAGVSSPRSPQRAFAVVGAQPPGLLGPDADASVNAIGMKTMTFRWSGVGGAQRYRFELSRDREFKKLVRSDTVPEASHSVPMPAPGVYFWRVRLVDEDGGAVSASAVRRFTVSEMIGSPAGVYPVNNEVVSVDDRGGLVFKWKEVEGATQYRFTLKQRVAGGKERTLLATRVDATRYKLKKIELLDVGSFVWEISALRQKGDAVTAQSAPGRNYFSIRLGKQLKAPKLKSDVIYVE
ncbi:MAG TPA: FecR domain-containing protein [Spirochaetota bacterium]|nr:FecR domain-containing protein [Spirochaetota bacterium]HPC39708.1 FecR domain-containing protein [Spirochaetota bacterium]HPL18777.1 FecR domain-containing protein [Spirochaetota bacterium]HQJ69896.1 FecR domain-containing protein [Spirochaetota bacterium]HRS76353.1 FecR domain-containing protein [Spirochaetota bacterium]